MIGIEPAVRRAVQENPGGRILSLATAGTLASPRYQRQLQEIAASEQVVSIAAPGIVNYVEDGMRDREGVVAYLRKLFAPWQPARFDGVVLGCTHYPLVSDSIRRLYPGLPLIDPAEEMARSLKNYLDREGLSNPRRGSGTLTVYTTGDVEEYTLRARQVGLERVAKVEYYPPMIL